MGGAQPLAVTSTTGRRLRSTSAHRLQRRVEHRYLDEVADDLDDAIAKSLASRRNAGLVRRCRPATPPGLPRVAAPWRRDRHRHRPDQRARPLSYSRPASRTLDEWRGLPKKPEEFTDRARESMARHVGRWSGSWTAARRRSSTTATTFARWPARLGGRRLRLPGFVPAYIRPLFCEGKGRSAGPALSGDPKDIAATDKGRPRPLPRQRPAPPLDQMARRAHCVAGLPARICWLGYGERDKAASPSTTSSPPARSGAIVIGRDHLDCGSVASPIARPGRCSTAPTRSPTGRS